MFMYVSSEPASVFVASNSFKIPHHSFFLFPFPFLRQSFTDSISHLHYYLLVSSLDFLEKKVAKS